MRFSFIHTSDIHLGRPFSDLSTISDKTGLCNQACRNAFHKIVDTAISKKVDFVLIAGDSFDNDEHDLSTKLLFVKNLEKLADNGIKSYIICGNHDPAQLYRQYSSYFKFDKKYSGMINITGVTTDSCCEVFNYNDIVNIHSLSFESEECSNPAKILEPVKCNDSVFNIGLIHCDLDKTDSKYAPCSNQDLKNLGYDYYALGHIHIPEYRSDNIVYSGSPQGRTKKETGAHGFYYVEADGKQILNKEFITSDYVRFTALELDCSSLNNKREVFDEIIQILNQQNEDVELTLYEINLTGISEAYDELSSGDLISEYIENYAQTEPQKSAVYRINNLTIPNVDENELLKDTGIIGLISGCCSDTEKLDGLYDEISNLHSNIYKKLQISVDSKSELTEQLVKEKDEIMTLAKKEIIALCKEIYNMD